MTHFYFNAFLRGNNIYYTGYDDGKRVKRRVNYQPYLFLPNTIKEHMKSFRTLDGRGVDKKVFSNISEANKFIREHKDVSNFTIYGNTNFLYTWINDTFPGQMEYDSSLINVIFLDIEVESDKGLPDYRNPIFPVNAITISKHGKKITFGCGEYKPKGLNSAYVPCKNEKNLLLKFLEIWNSPSYNPDVLTGWHIDGFDIPYLYNRIKKILGEDTANKLSPWGVVEEREVTYKFKETTDLVYDLKGISVLDYLTLYRKFSFKNHESYALNFIANEELGEGKTDYSEHESLLKLAQDDYEKFIDYNIRDVELVEKLDNKLKLIEQVFAIAYDAKVTYGDTLATIRMWDTIIHNYLLEQYIVVPPMKKSSHDELLGAYVKEPQLGMHKWVVSFHLASLYPHLIIQYNIGPDTFVKDIIDTGFNTEQIISEVLDGKLKKLTAGYEDLTMQTTVTANLCLYRKDRQSFLGALMEKMYKDRDTYKKQRIAAQIEYEKTRDPELKQKIAQYGYLQMAKKIQMNSGYGAIANPYFRYYNHNDAEAITATGQLAIRWVESRLNKFFNKLYKASYPSELESKDVDYIIASDTDSLYVNFAPIVEKRWKGCDTATILKNINAACNHAILPFIAKCYEELAEYTNAYKNCMDMKREAIAEKGLWTAKKRYILNVWDSEGVRYKEPQLKISGIESVRSSTPAICREYIERALQIIMNKDEAYLQKFIGEFRGMFGEYPVDEVAFPRSISGLAKYQDAARIYAKSTPIQVKGALIYNNLIAKNSLDKRYPLIYNGDKIKFVYLKTPNPIHEHVISFVNVIPKDFGVNNYIDYDTQFTKGFLDPISTVLEAIGWKHGTNGNARGVHGMNLAKRILKNTTIGISDSLENSIFFSERDMITTPVPMINVALSGRIDGGLSSGVTVLAGPSKNFKTGFALLFAASYLKKYPEAAMLFYDSEFGTPQNYFETFGIPMDRVVHTPVTDIEELKHDIVNQLKGIERGDKLIIVIDSLGSLASVKEIEDAEAGKSVADMTRAKQMKSLFRMITPYGGLKDIPIVVVNHTYKEIGLFPKDIVSGGTGAYYSADTIWILGRQQDKGNDGVQGYHFIINVEKSRFVKEKSKIPITVSFESGVQRWAGLFDCAEELGFINSPAKGWYMLTTATDERKFRRADVEYDNDFWVKVLAETDLSAYIRDKYQLSSQDMLAVSEEDK